MKLSPSAVGLMLTNAILLILPIPSTSAPHAHKRRHEHNKLSARNTPLATLTSIGGTASLCSGSDCTSPASLPPSVTCPSNNNTVYTTSPRTEPYNIICDIDFVGQNIYPFVLATSFDDCKNQCETFNSKNQGKDTLCAGFVFAPDRISDTDDCYLKSALESPIIATIPLVGATVIPASATLTSKFSSVTKGFSSPSVSSISLSLEATILAAAQATPKSAARHIIIPKVSDFQLHGASENNPTNQYIEHPPVSPIKLESNVLVPGINPDLASNYEIAGDTGTLMTSSVRGDLADLSVVPHLSRDGGKGGAINGTNIFIFCDTAGFTTTNDTHNGSMVSFVSSSVATDSGTNGLYGRPLSLVDAIGEWQDDVGRLRGYAPMTTGEEAFNVALSGNGFRYAVWPETSLIPLNQTHSIQYASLVYDEVDMQTQAAIFTTLGNTLLTISVDPKHGPVAERTVKRLFDQNEVQWGSIGGIRSWGSAGIGGNDGTVYVFGQGGNENGLLLARTNATGVGDRSQYQYWTGSTWSSGMLPNTSTSYFVNGSFMDVDLFYSPRHATFVMVSLTSDADNTFYYRYLNAPNAILPSYTTGHQNIDFVESIIKHPWSDPQILYKAHTPAVSFIYAGGVHAGYFGTDDITNGGTKMLLSWTAHTGQDAASPQSGYAHMTAAITLE